MAFNNLRASLSGIGFEAVDSIRAALDLEGKVSTGNLRNNTRFEVVDTGNVISLLFKAPKHWKFVDKGRKPGKFPPINKISSWIRSKGIDANPFVIARSIAENGIPPTEIYTDAIDSINNNLRQRLGRLASDDLEKEILKTLKTK